MSVCHITKFVKWSSQPCNPKCFALLDSSSAPSKSVLPWKKTGNHWPRTLRLTLSMIEPTRRRNGVSDRRHFATKQNKFWNVRCTWIVYLLFLVLLFYWLFLARCYATSQCDSDGNCCSSSTSSHLTHTKSETDTRRFSVLCAFVVLPSLFLAGCHSVSHCNCHVYRCSTSTSSHLTQKGQTQLTPISLFRFSRVGCHSVGQCDSDGIATALQFPRSWHHEPDRRNRKLRFYVSLFDSSLSVSLASSLLRNSASATVMGIARALQLPLSNAAFAWPWLMGRFVSTFNAVQVRVEEEKDGDDEQEGADDDDEEEETFLWKPNVRAHGSEKSSKGSQVVFSSAHDQTLWLPKILLASCSPFVDVFLFSFCISFDLIIRGWRWTMW